MAFLRPDIRKNPNASLEQLKHDAAQARLPYDVEGWQNLAFYLGQQYTEWHPASRSMREIPRHAKTPREPRPTFNKIMHFVQQERAMVLQAEPSVDIMPATDDYEDMIEAGVARAYCEWVSEPTQANFDRQLARATLWALTTYEGYLKWVWNPREDRPDVIPCSPFEIFPDPYAKDFAKARYVIHSQFMDVEQAYEAYGVELPASASEAIDPMRSELLRGMGSAPVVNGVTVNELWYRPCRRYPNGLYAVWSGTSVLVAPGKLPYEHQRLPFTQIGAIERPDSQHFMAPTQFLRSPQMYFNRYMAQRIKHRERFANFKWWIPEELQLEADPDDSPAQILRGHGTAGGLKPEILAPPAMPDNGDGQAIEEQMMHLVGLHEVSQAQVPGRVEAAKAIEILKESDADRQKTTLDTITASISEGFYQILMLAKQYAKTEQLVPVYSTEGVPEVKRFMATKLKPGIRVNVTMGTGLARSRAARQDDLMNLWQNGIIRDPAMMRELLQITHRSFDIPGAQDLRLARNENLEMSQGVPVQANSWDDHELHLREHNNYRKTAEFRGLEQQRREMFEFHCQQHETLWEQELAVQARRAQLQAAAGIVPGGGGEKTPVVPTAPPAPTSGGSSPADQQQTDGQVNA